MKKHMKRALSLIISLVLVISFVGCTSNGPSYESDDVNTNTSKGTNGEEIIGFGGGASGGGFYTFANLLSVALTKDGIGQFSGQATTGGTNNALLMKAGELGIALMNGVDAMEAYTGSNEAFAGNPYTDLRAILKWDSAYAVYVVSNEINNFNDLIGKKVVVGGAGSGEFNHTNRILNAADISLDQIKAQMVGVGEGKEMLTNKLAVAQLHVGGIPYSAITELLLSGRLKLMSFPENIIEKLCDGSEAVYTRGIIPANSYEGQTDDIYCLGIPYGIFCTADSLTEDQVYQITKYIFENTEQITKNYASAKFDLEESSTFSEVPYHPGAIKYYKEMGKL